MAVQDGQEPVYRPRPKGVPAVEHEQLEIHSCEEDFGQVAVGQLVDRLPESERALFALRYFEGYNATELGDLFDLPPSTVRARLASARKKMMDWYVEP